MEEVSASSSSIFFSANHSLSSNGSQSSSSDALSPLPLFNKTPNLEADEPETSKNAAARYRASRLLSLELGNISSDKQENPNLNASLLMPPAKIRSCDVYIGLHVRKPSLVRFVNWLRAELELQGVSCFVGDRSRSRGAQDRAMVEMAMGAATLGVVMVTKRSLSSPFSIEEIRCFLGKKNLVPIFFGLGREDCLLRDVIEKRGVLWEKHGGELWLSYGGLENEWKEAVGGLSYVGSELKLEAHAGNWRDCITNAVVLLGIKLGRRHIMERMKSWKERVEKEEFPFPQNENFVGRKKELLELELILFGDIDGDGENECFELKTSNRHQNSTAGARKKNNKAMVSVENRVDGRDGEGKSKKPVIWKESEEEIEMEGIDSLPRHYWHPRGKKRSANVLYGKGIACVTGDSGIGKTELLLEYAYRFSQRYRLVLWVSGEARYICQNYMNLSPLLGIDLNAENELCPEREKRRSFKELEEEAIRRVRKELMRDIPFLVVIDNLEDEKEWWEGENVMNLLPRFGGETHIIISTRLPRILNMEPLNLSYLSNVEALSLMKGRLTDLPMEELNALRVIEEKLGRITLGLSLVGAIFSELSINPSRLLDTINAMPTKQLHWSGREDPVFRHHPFFLQLLDVCFSIFDHEHGPRSLATRMALVSGWFAPSPIRVPLLAFAASVIVKEGSDADLWKKCLHTVTCGCFTSNLDKSEDEASAMLVRFRVARSSAKRGYIHIHDIFRLYARKRAGIGGARAMVRAISIRGSIPRDTMHIWAGCFLILKFGTDPCIVELKIPELVSFTKQLALPLAVLTYTTFFRFGAAKELLHLCTVAVEAAEEHVEEELEKALCWVSSKKKSNPTVYRLLAVLKATLLETRVELMLKGGEYDIAEGLCRTAISIRQVLCGWDHSSTVYARETMDKIVRFQANMEIL